MVLEAAVPLHGMREDLHHDATLIASQTVLSVTIWIDKIYFNVSESGRIRAGSGNLLHGISRNKACVKLAVESSGRAYGKVMGPGKPISGMIAQVLAGHVRSGNLIVHNVFHGMPASSPR
jgi:hypothetical protein